MTNTQTGLVHLNFAADVNQMVSVYSDALVSPVAGTPGTVVKMYVYQYTADNVVTFSGFNFIDSTPPELGSSAGSHVTVYFACVGANQFDELRREVVTA